MSLKEDLTANVRYLWLQDFTTGRSALGWTQYQERPTIGLLHALLQAADINVPPQMRAFPAIDLRKSPLPCVK